MWLRGLSRDRFLALKNDEPLIACSGAGDIYRQCRFFLWIEYD